MFCICFGGVIRVVSWFWFYFSVVVWVVYSWNRILGVVLVLWFRESRVVSRIRAVCSYLVGICLFCIVNVFIFVVRMVLI